MTAISRLPGFQDVLPEDRRYWDFITNKAVDLAQRFGFQRFDIPVIEDTSLFVRGVGEASDFFVKKEMYTIIEDEEKMEAITVRPEFTAGMVRAYVQNGLHNWPQPVKMYTIGPAFRRERQQAGRFRQHSQFDVEILGETDPAADLEVMMLAASLYRELGYGALKFQLNSTGCPDCKPAYVKALVEFLSDYTDKLPPVDQERLHLNPLRILDSKEEYTNELLKDAPHIIDYLCDDCANHFADLRGLLDALNQQYEINFRLVRGIDYYTKTVFEVWDQRIGAQSALCGGGRYDGLAEAIGGPSTPGVGFGLGLERAVLALQEEGIEPPTTPEPAVFIAHFGDETKTKAVELTYQLREAGIGTRLAFARDKRSMKSQMREANKYDTKYVLILGGSELENGVATVRPMDERPQTEVPFSELIPWLKENL